jgi:class 3 adenylate cyclase
MNNGVRYRYSSLEDFLISNQLSVDGILDDGWGAKFPVKGREIEASILFSDISSFSERTSGLTATETLIFVNNFFAWITAEALRGQPGIIDKYIGDEIMVVFSKEFGSEDPFVDALRTARWMAENDALSFGPHMGVASGVVTVGYVGTPLKYNCSVYGFPIVVAKRCASIQSTAVSGSSIFFPAELWKGYNFENVFPPVKFQNSNKETYEQPTVWELQPPREESMKNLPPMEIIEIVKKSVSLPSRSAEDRAKDSLKGLKEQGVYHSRFTG